MGYKENPSIRKVIRMLMAMALLPAHKAEDGFTYVVTYANQRNVFGLEGIQQLLNYFQDYWLNSK